MLIVRVFHNSRNRPVTVARGPVPRECEEILTVTVGRGPVPRHASRCLNQDLQDSRICRILCLAAAKPLFKKSGLIGRRSMARDRPSPYDEGGRSAAKKPSGYRSAGALGCHTRIRAGFPRERPVGATSRSRCNRLVRVQAHPNYKARGRAACSSGVPAPELFVLRGLQTT